jgi:restriction system protein
MGFLDAAEEVLRQASEPLHYREITERARARNLVETKGQTPARTMNAQLSTSIGSGESPFVRVGRGVYGLAAWEHEAKKAVVPTSTTPEPKREYRSYKDAAQQVLTEVGRPLHYKKITQYALDAELINPQGLTPEATMGAQLYTDIKRRGAASAFRKESRGVFGLAAWEKGVSGIARLAARQRVAVEKQLLNHLLSMEPGDFEQLVGRLLGAMGYDNVTVTRRSADGGVDVLADIEVGILRLRTAVQVKRMKSNVQRPVVSQLRGDMMTLPDADQGMIITTSGFSAGATEVARVRNAPPIVLIDGSRLADLLIEHEIGARVERVEIVTFDEERLWTEDEG